MIVAWPSAGAAPGGGDASYDPGCAARIGQDEACPDPAQAKLNTSGKARTTVQAQTAYTIM